MVKFCQQPKICNLCGGNVIYTTNDKIYGKKYGNGKCYLCTSCGAYVGVHTNTNIALGILANSNMREMKIKCHCIFDKMWNDSQQRNKLYYKLAKEMGIDRNHCHFGHFDLQELEMAYSILKQWEMNCYRLEE